jgi:ABC-type nitrate/sulfonate/bicarbonate transport system ATPase subunit
MTQAVETPLALDCRGLRKTYGTRTVLQNLDLQLQAGEYVAIMGESGVGKSTFLNLVAGLDATQGRRAILPRSGKERKGKKEEKKSER